MSGADADKGSDDDSGPQKVDINKIQQEMNNLVERRLSQVRKLTEAEAEKAEASEKVKGCKKEMASIDDLMQEKLDELNKYR